jgi:GDPmannose 4,6-dehydratase
MREFLQKSFSYVGLDYLNHIKINESFIKNKNKTIIVSDTSKIKRDLNWSTKKSIDDLIKIMIDNKIK